MLIVSRCGVEITSEQNRKEAQLGRVTIKSIAKDLGISHMTVSRALSDHPNVQRATRQAVLKRALELGYVKSAAAKAMRGDSTQIVGLLLPNIVNEFYARFANTLAQACEQSSYHLIIHLTNDDIELERRSLERLREVQAMAVIMVPVPGAPEGIDLQLQSMKTIQLIRQRSLTLPNIALLIDDGCALSDAVMHLAQRGCRSIAYVGADEQLSSGRERLQAFRSGLLAAGLTEKPELICTADPSFEMGRESAASLLEEGKVDGLVCGGFEISNGVLSILMERGINPQSDMPFVGYGDPSFYAWIGTGISTIEIPVDQLAFRATELLNSDDNWDSICLREQGRFDANLLLRGN